MLARMVELDRLIPFSITDLVQNMDQDMDITLTTDSDQAMDTTRTTVMAMHTAAIMVEDSNTKINL